MLLDADFDVTDGFGPSSSRIHRKLIKNLPRLFHFNQDNEQLFGVLSTSRLYKDDRFSMEIHNNSKCAFEFPPIFLSLTVNAITNVAKHEGLVYRFFQGYRHFYDAPTCDLTFASAYIGFELNPIFDLISLDITAFRALTHFGISEINFSFGGVSLKSKEISTINRLENSLTIERVSTLEIEKSLCNFQDLESIDLFLRESLPGLIHTITGNAWSPSFVSLVRLEPQRQIVGRILFPNDPSNPYITSSSGQYDFENGIRLLSFFINSGKKISEILNVLRKGEGEAFDLIEGQRAVYSALEGYIRNLHPEFIVNNGRDFDQSVLNAFKNLPDGVKTLVCGGEEWESNNYEYVRESIKAASQVRHNRSHLLPEFIRFNPGGYLFIRSLLWAIIGTDAGIECGMKDLIGRYARN